jgi:hypothetical protein
MLVTFEHTSSIRFWHIESENFSWFGQIRPTWASFKHGISAHKDLSRNLHYSFYENRSLRMLTFVTKGFSSISSLLQNSTIRSKMPKDSSFSALLCTHYILKAASVTNTRCCRYSCRRSWRWVEATHKTCRAVSRYNKLCKVASCWIYIGICYLWCTNPRTSKIHSVLHNLCSSANIRTNRLQMVTDWEGRQRKWSHTIF